MDRLVTREELQLQELKFNKEIGELRKKNAELYNALAEARRQQDKGYIFSQMHGAPPFLWVYDTTAGFKCYRRQVLETIELDKIRFKGYAFQIEMKYTAYKCGFTIQEVPIVFVNRVLGTSKMSGGIFSEALLGVIKLKLSSLTRKYPQKQ